MTPESEATRPEWRRWLALVEEEDEFEPFVGVRTFLLRGGGGRVRTGFEPMVPSSDEDGAVAVAVAVATMPPAEPRAPRSGFGGAAEAAALAVAAEAVVLAIAAGACPVAAAAAACMRSCSCLFRPARLDGSQPAPSRSEPRRRSGGRAPSSLLRADPPPAASRLGTTSLHMQNARLPSGSSMPWFEQNWAKHACWRCSSQPYVEHCRLSARSCSWHSGWRHARSEDRGEDRPRGASVGEDR